MQGNTPNGALGDSLPKGNAALEHPAVQLIDDGCALPLGGEGNEPPRAAHSCKR